MSLINLGVGLVSANALTKMTAGTNLIPFMVDGWFGATKSTSTDNSWELSLSELVGAGFGGNAGIASSYKWKGEGGIMGVVKRNASEYGAASVMTVIAAPIVAKMLRRFARTPIRQFNGLWKGAGLESATGVRL